MFEVESVPSRDNASYLLLLLSRHNRVQSLRLLVRHKMNKTFMQSVKTCYSLHILMLLKVVWVHYNVIYVTFSTIPLILFIFV